MNRNKLKTYAPDARRKFIEAVTERAAHYGLTAKKIEPMIERGDVWIIAGQPFAKAVGRKRRQLEARLKRIGFDQTMEAMAYTWFNRLIAIRYMELHGYLEHGYRVLSHPEGHSLPEIVEHAEHVDLPYLNKQKVIELKLDGTKEEELYRLLLVAQCNALHKAMPFLFESIDDETELVLPDHLLHSDSLIRKLVSEISEEDWQQVEIIGWLYQFYISERKDEVIRKVVKSEDIPAATQLFTPNWIVKYLVQNSLGRQWVATYPNSRLKEQMEYYIEPAEQTPEVQAKLAEITPTSLNPEELTLLDPACGSGHILVEAYDLLKMIYQERGYRAKDIPRLILEKNLYGLEIDDRAAQLAAFALVMKARADDRNIFASGVQPHVLSIQESKGVDAREITEALNQPILKEVPPPSGELFDEIADAKSPLFSKKNLGARGGISQADVAHLISMFEHGKTFGSLIRLPEALAERLPAIVQRVEDVIAHGGMLERPAAMALRPLLEQARILAAQFDAVVANPPYMGSSNGMNELLKGFADNNFPDAKQNLCTVFIDQGIGFLKSNASMGMVTLQGWMFADRYTSFRKNLLTEGVLSTMAHLGPDAFPEITGEVVQTTAFCYRKCARTMPSFKPVFCPLYKGDSEDKRMSLSSGNERISDIPFEAFNEMPGCAFLYWASKRIRELFAASNRLNAIMDTREGMTTADNDRFLRWFWEVSISTVKRDCDSLECAKSSGMKWFPYVKGGEFRRWYGNTGYVVNWYDDGKEIKSLVNPKTGNVRSHNYNGDYAFRRGLSWTSISTKSMAARAVPAGGMFDTKGPMAFFKDDRDQSLALGIINSRLGYEFMRLIAPSLDFKLGHVGGIPLVNGDETLGKIVDNVAQSVQIARRDWDEHETSWDFRTHPLLNNDLRGPIVAESIRRWNKHCGEQFDKLKRLEVENNQSLLKAYGLHDELSPEVPDDQITLYRPGQKEDIKRLISYAIGCMMGRYSLDEPGLIYADSGNYGFDPSKYQKFPADDDGIIPLTEFDWFPDDTASRFEKFIATAWPAAHLEENLKFVANCLGPKKGESPRDTIRHYLATDFYKHHLSMYKKRPIYWLFSSGKQRGFQALVYLHRYNESTLARMRTKYVIPLLAKMTARIAHLNDDSAAATSSQYKKRLETEKATIAKQLAEVQAFDEKLRHYADQRIKLDLDDGVRVNYGKLGDLLADVKAVCGKSEDE